MPAMIVCAVSSSVRTWKVGSSSESANSAFDILSWSAFDCRFDRDVDHRVGELELFEHDLVARDR